MMEKDPPTRLQALVDFLEEHGPAKREHIMRSLGWCQTKAMSAIKDAVADGLIVRSGHQHDRWFELKRGPKVEVPVGGVRWVFDLGAAC